MKVYDLDGKAVQTAFWAPYGSMFVLCVGMGTPVLVASKEAIADALTMPELHHLRNLTPMVDCVREVPTVALMKLTCAKVLRPWFVDRIECLREFSDLVRKVKA